jgi:biotin carboxyl carrier protein
MTDLLTRPDAPPAPATPVHGEPATALRGSVAASLALVVAPSTGRFHPVAGAAGGGAAGEGELVGHVTGGRGRADAVIAPVDGTVAALLVRPGQLVRTGQALVALTTGGA